MTKQFRRHQKGHSVVEMALVVPLLCALLLGGIDIGRLAYLSILLTSGARAGIQYGAQNQTTAIDNTGMQNAATNDAANPTGMTATAKHYCVCANGNASTCLSTDCAGSRIQEYVEVDTTAPFTPLFGYPGLPGSSTVATKAVMRVLQ